MLNEAGEVELRLGSTVLHSGQKLLTRKWYFVAASYDAATGTIELHQDLLADRTMTVASSVMRSMPRRATLHGAMGRCCSAPGMSPTTTACPVIGRWSAAASMARSNGRVW